MNRTKWFALFALCLVGRFAEAQDVISLKELARRENNTVTMRVNVEWPLVPLETMVKQADLIVRGTIKSAVSKLSDDESFVYTDYTIVPIDVLKQPAGLAVAPQPGQTIAITIRELGGTVVVDGLRLRTQTESDKEDLMVLGGEYLFILQRASGQLGRAAKLGSPTFEAGFGPFAMLRIENGKVRNMNKFVADRRPLSTDQPDRLVADIRQMLATRR